MIEDYSPTQVGVLLLLGLVAAAGAAVGTLTAAVVAVRGAQAVIRAVAR